MTTHSKQTARGFGRLGDLILPVFHVKGSLQVFRARSHPKRSLAVNPNRRVHIVTLELPLLL